MPFLAVCLYVPGFGRLAEPVAAKYTTQTLAGLEYLHQMRVIHRDIKGDNILVTGGLL
eukprot:SAG22_NODE_690_length_7891_cov_11.959322_4_plen_58_part_00